MCGGSRPETERLVGLAGDVSRSMPDAITLLLTGSGTDAASLPDRVVLVEMPTGDGPTGSARRAHLVDEVAADFRPDVIVVDSAASDMIPRARSRARAPVVLAAHDAVPSLAAFRAGPA